MSSCYSAGGFLIFKGFDRQSAQQMNIIIHGDIFCCIVQNWEGAKPKTGVVEILAKTGGTIAPPAPT